MRPRRVLAPLDWALTGPVRGLRGDLQELLLFPLVRRFAKIRVRGEHNLATGGPFVFVSNHTSHFDCPIILAALPHEIRARTIVAAAADYFYKIPAIGALTSLALGTIPFERHEGSRESLERCKEGLRRGWSVLIFPEGSRSKTGMIGHFKKGAAYLSVDAPCSAVPIFLQGAYEIMPKGSSVPRPGKVTVTFGPPVLPRTDDDYDTFTSRLEVAVADLSAP